MFLRNFFATFSFPQLLLNNFYHIFPATFFLLIFSIVSPLVIFLKLFSFQSYKSTIYFLFIRFFTTIQVKICFVCVLIPETKTISVFCIICISSTKLIVIRTELLSISGLVLFKFLFLKILDQCKLCVFQACNLLLNWRHIYEMEEILGFVKIKRGMKEFLQRFISLAMTSI